MKEKLKPWVEYNELEHVNNSDAVYNLNDYEFLKSFQKEYKNLTTEGLKPENELNENDIIVLLVEKILRLEEIILEIKRQNHHVLVQNMLAQSQKNVKELANIFKTDDAVYNPRDLEGLLSAYSDSQSSVEWVRSVRDV